MNTHLAVDEDSRHLGVDLADDIRYGSDAQRGPDDEQQVDTLEVAPQRREKVAGQRLLEEDNVRLEHSSRCCCR